MAAIEASLSPRGGEGGETGGEGGAMYVRISKFLQSGGKRTRGFCFCGQLDGSLHGPLHTRHPLSRRQSVQTHTHMHFVGDGANCPPTPPPRLDSLSTVDKVSAFRRLRAHRN